MDAKVFADDQLRVLWHENDLVSIFNKYTYNKQYKFNGNTGDNAGSFSEVPGSEFVTYLFTEKSFETFNEFKYFTHIYEIPERLFYGCWSLKAITLPANISSIGASAFEMCTALTALDVPASCKSVSNYAFSECNNLKTLIFRSTTTHELNYLCFGMTDNCPTETLIIYAMIPDYEVYYHTHY